MNKTSEPIERERNRRRQIKYLFSILGVISGFPLAFTASMIQMWLTSYNIPLKTLGLLSSLSLPYALKFLWIPFLEKYYLGSTPYRFWMSMMCFALSLLLLFLSQLNPLSQVFSILMLTMAIAFCSASFDAMLDGWRLSHILEKDMGLASSVYVAGYRIGLLLTGGLGAILVDPSHLGFSKFYQLSSVFLLLSTFFTLLLPDLPLCIKNVQKPSSLFSGLKNSLWEISTIRGITYLIGIIATYRLCDTLLAALSTYYFQHELGYSLVTLGYAYKLSGLGATIAGTFIGGLWIDRNGVYRLLNKICLIQGLANFSYLYLYYSYRTIPDLFIVVSIEHFCSGLANAACVVLLSSVAMKIVKHQATAYALLTALFVPARIISGPIAAFMVEIYGWPIFIIFSSAVVLIPMNFVLLYEKSSEQSLSVKPKPLS